MSSSGTTMFHGTADVGRCVIVAPHQQAAVAATADGEAIRDVAPDADRRPVHGHGEVVEALLLVSTHPTRCHDSPSSAPPRMLSATA